MQTWLITGISSGLGYEMARQLLLKGNRVIGTVRNSQSVERMKEEYPTLLEYYILDITDTDAICKFAQWVSSKYSRIDVVVNNAGYGMLGAIEELADDEIEKIIATNLTGNILFIKSILKKLRKQGGGRIIQISSYNDQVPAKGWGMYCATKAGISSFCETLAQEVAPFHIGVTIIEPGAVRTDYFKHVKMADFQSEYKHCHESLMGLQNAKETKQGDPVKIVNSIINSARIQPAPLYLLLGSHAWEQTMHTLRKRMEIYEEQRQNAISTDVINNKSRGKKKIYYPTIAKDRKVIIWGVGQECANMLHWFDWSEWDTSIECFIDKSEKKAGKICLGREIKKPEEIEEWGRYFVVITSTLCYSEIAEILVSYGMKEERDFIIWRNLIKRVILGVDYRQGIYTVSGLAGNEEMRMAKNRICSVALEECIQENGLSIADVDAVMLCGNPLEKIGGILDDAENYLKRKERISQSIRKDLTIVEQLERFSGRKWKIYFCGRNMATTIAVFRRSGLVKTAVVVFDNYIGNTTIGMVNEKKCLQIKEMDPVDSLELFYDAFAECYTELQDVDRAKKIAVTGKTVLCDWLRENCIWEYGDGSIKVNRKFFFYNGQKLEISSEGINLLAKLNERREDLFASLQKIISEVVERTILYAKKITGMTEVCLWGRKAVAFGARNSLKQYEVWDGVQMRLEDNKFDHAIGGAIYGFFRIFDIDKRQKQENGNENNLVESNWRDVRETDSITFMRYSSLSKVKDIKQCINSVYEERECVEESFKRKILVDILSGS